MLPRLCLALISVLAAALATAGPLVPVERARLHPIVASRAAVDFFEGALLGNGGLGAVVTTRPDGVAVFFGHNNVWDIRIAEENRDKLGTFAEVFAKVKAIPESYRTLDQDPWYREYRAMSIANYRKPYPRPFPCGTFLLGFDRRKVELVGHRLDISTGLCTVDLLVDGKPARLEIFVDQRADRLWLRLVDGQGQLLPSCFERVRLIPDSSTPPELPRFSACPVAASDTLAFRQVLPKRVDGRPGEGDHAFKLTTRFSGDLAVLPRKDRRGQPVAPVELERALASGAPLLACVELKEGLATQVDEQAGRLPEPTADAWSQAQRNSARAWEEFWNRSGVALADPILERTWYWNLYFFNCATRSDAICPGLFGPWSYEDIGTAWHGDYHMDYNAQQPFWMPLAANHADKNLAYVSLVEHLLPVSRDWAKEFYQLPGAYFPTSAYPVEMTMNPYPVPTWGWQVCQTPWTVQGAWWQYLYTQDKEYLRARGFVPLKEATAFLVAYMRRPEAHGPQWGDDRYHIFPTVPTELYGLMPGFKYNSDCLVDLTLTKFVFRAYLESVRVLKLERSERELMRQTREVLAHMPDYPTADSPAGRVFVSVQGESSEIVYNVPNSLMTVFPGEEHGLGSSPEMRQLLANTYKNQRNEGGNELVFLNLQAARLGLLDLDKFRRQIEYCILPDGACTDKVLSVGGRYSNNTAYDYMGRMGIWVENFALPAVLNECLMQSYDGTIRLFPNWPAEREAEFRTLRAAGAFLVSAALKGGQVQAVEITSEAGCPLRVESPWKSGARVERAGKTKLQRGALLQLATRPGETLRLLPPQE